MLSFFGSLTHTRGAMESAERGQSVSEMIRLGWPSEEGLDRAIGGRSTSRGNITPGLPVCDRATEWDTHQQRHAGIHTLFFRSIDFGGGGGRERMRRSPSCTKEEEGVGHRRITYLLQYITRLCWGVRGHPRMVLRSMYSGRDSARLLHVGAYGSSLRASMPTRGLASRAARRGRREADVSTPAELSRGLSMTEPGGRR